MKKSILCDHFMVEKSSDHVNVKNLRHPTRCGIHNISVLCICYKKCQNMVVMMKYFVYKANYARTNLPSRAAPIVWLRNKIFHFSSLYSYAACLMHWCPYINMVFLMHFWKKKKVHQCYYSVLNSKNKMNSQFYFITY